MPKSAFTEEYAMMLRLIVETRRERGMTQVQLAYELGKPQPWVSKVERGVRRIDVIEFYAIASAIGVDPTRLFDGLAKQLPTKVVV